MKYIVSLIILLISVSAYALPPSPPGGSSTGTKTDTSNFDNNLSSSDDTVQKALETLDETAGGTGAPTDVDYWVSTADAGLSAEQVVDSAATLETAAALGDFFSTAFGDTIDSEALFKAAVNLEDTDINNLAVAVITSQLGTAYDSEAEFTALFAAKEGTLTNEAGLYSALSDVSLFYEPGDTLQTNSGTTLPATCTVGETFVDTDADTNGSLYICVSTDTWKEVDDDGGTGTGDAVSIDGVAVTDPDFVSTGDIDFVDTSNTVTGNINTGAVGDAEIDYTAVTLGDLTFDVGSVSTTEFGYLDGVTSAIQTQIDAKAATADLGTVAQYDTGTDIGDIPILVDNGSGSPALGFALKYSTTNFDGIFSNTTSYDTAQELFEHIDDNVAASDHTHSGVYDTKYISGTEADFYGTILNPQNIYDNDATNHAVTIITDVPAAFTITEIGISCDADPTTELTMTFQHKAAGVGYGSPTTIEAVTTTAGTATIPSGIDDATIPAGTKVFVSLSDPDDALLECAWQIEGDWD